VVGSLVCTVLFIIEDKTQTEKSSFNAVSAFLPCLNDHSDAGDVLCGAVVQSSWFPSFLQ
jgi:hypothetical protein